MDFRGLCVRWAYIGTMKKERILVLDLLKIRADLVSSYLILIQKFLLSR